MLKKKLSHSRHWHFSITNCIAYSIKKKLMFPICRCGRSRDSLDGSRCLYCDTVIPTTPANFQPAVSESANVNPGVPASEAITRMADFVSSFSNQFDGDGNYPQISDQEAAANRNVLPLNPNINKDCIYDTKIGRCNSESIGPSLASVADSHVVPEKRTYLDEQPTHNQRQYIDEEGKLDFAGSIHFQSEYSVPNSNPDSSVNVNSSFVLARKSTDHFPRNVEATKSDLEHEVHNSGKERRNVSKPKMLEKQSLRCGKCGESFLKEWIFQVHVANCNRDPYKCDLCGMIFPDRRGWWQHQPVHTADKPFKCDQCAFATKWKWNLKKHKMIYHKNNLLYQEIVNLH